MRLDGSIDEASEFQKHSLFVGVDIKDKTKQNGQGLAHQQSVLIE